MSYTRFHLIPGQLTLKKIRTTWQHRHAITLDKNAYALIDASTKTIADIVATNKTAYGVNTGFGRLANVTIPSDQLAQLQKNLLLSHATGTGALLDDDVVALILLLKINALARGYSGIRREIIDALIVLYNQQIYPCIPAKGSVGASGDLAPLAHLGAVLLGVGEVRYQGKCLSAQEGLALANLQPITLMPKEGLAIINGTQASTALALKAFFLIENVFMSALITGALSVDAAKGSDVPFDARIHQLSGHEGQIDVAAFCRGLLRGSQVRESHRDCRRVQDPYSLRCQPQVMGACLDQLRYAANVLLKEANAVSDNPLVFSEQEEVLSGGNFHAESVALVADALAVVIAEIGALSERRIALLLDPNFSGLPAFLVKHSGINSGFMNVQVTAAALASENKTLAHPASVDSIPTSANQEDHVSMATFAARRLLEMAENTATIVAIELLTACQGLEFHRPLKTSTVLQPIYDWVRQYIAAYDIDRFFAPDIALATAWVCSGELLEFVADSLMPSYQ